MSFTAELTFQTKFSEFRWEARTSSVVITDACEDGHGIAMSRLAGLLTLTKASRGPALPERSDAMRTGSLIPSPPCHKWTVVERVYIARGGTVVYRRRGK